MDINVIEDYFITDNYEKELWKNCIFIFDTSSLLDFYFFSSNSSDEIFNEIFENIKGKLWITNHIQFEYLKNRVNKLKNPITEKYNPLKNDFFKDIEDSIDKIERKLNDFNNKIKNKDQHPFLNDEKLVLDILIYQKNFKEHFIEFKSLAQDQIDIRIKK